MEKITLTTPKTGGGGFNVTGVRNQPGGGADTINNIIQNSLTILLVGVVILALIFLIWGGIEWVTSSGSKEKVQSAQKKIVLASVGLAIALGAFMIVNIVGELFGITFFGA